MHFILRILIGLLGVFYTLLGIGFLLQPMDMAASFFLEPVGIQGMATLRADFTAFFLTGGLFALYAAVKDLREALLVPLALIATAFTGRIVSLALDGMEPTAVQPMVVEAVTIALLLLALRTHGNSKA